MIFPTRIYGVAALSSLAESLRNKGLPMGQAPCSKVSAGLKARQVLVSIRAGAGPADPLCMIPSAKSFPTSSLVDCAGPARYLTPQIAVEPKRSANGPQANMAIHRVIKVRKLLRFGVTRRSHPASSSW